MRVNSQLVALSLIALCGCVSVPKADALRHTTAVLAAPGQSGSAIDERVKFRQLFCQVVHRDRSSDDPQCESMLWRLSDEPATPAIAAPLPKLRTDLRMLIIPGALNDCFGPDGLPFTQGIARLRSSGVRIDLVPVSGRSSSGHNARQIANFFAASDLAHSQPIVMLGYSKGVVDIQEFLHDFPDYARHVRAIVAIAGPVWGSPVADSSEWLYENLLSNAFGDRCDPGDGGLVRSLRTDVRAAWQRAHPLPDGIAYYFLGAFTTSEHLARGLRGTWRRLARTETRNDGQVRIEDEVQPGGVLLGYANADHWGTAIEIEKELDFIAHREGGNSFPQTALLEASWLYLGESLAPERGTP